MFSAKAVASIASIASVAALIALSLAAHLFSPGHAEQGEKPAQNAFTASVEEQRLVDTLREALRSPGLVSDDLPVVAKLGEVLEAELSANSPLWSLDN